MEKLNLDFEAIEDMLAAFQSPKGVKQVAIYYSPIYSFKTISVLIPESFEWSEIIVNHYPGNDRNGGRDERCLSIDDDPVTYIEHGHDRNSFCRGDYYCHVVGYRPTGKEKPSFLEGFYLKWPYLKPAPQQLEFGL